MLFLVFLYTISKNYKDKCKINERSFSEWGFGKNQEILTVASVGKDLNSRISFFIKRFI